MKVSQLSAAELASRLRSSGIYLQVGAFIVHVVSPIRQVAAGIGLLYADHAIEEHADFADFHLRILPSTGVRRWLYPQVIFFLDQRQPFKPLPREQAFPMFEWGLNWCIANHAHQYLILHAAVIEKNGYAAVMSAPPGSGKSTLCAGLIDRGWRLLSDELALVSLVDGALVPIVKPISLKNHSIEVIRQFASDAVFDQAVNDTTKGTVAHMKPPVTSIDRSGDTAQPAWLIFPKYEAEAPTRLLSRSKAQTFMHFADNAFNYSLLDVDGFNALAELVDRCDCYNFTYSRLHEAVEQFDALALSIKHA